MPMLAIKYRLYPTPAQESVFRQTLEVCRQVYNSMVGWRKHDYESQGNSPNYKTQQNVLPLWKRTHPELCAVYAQALQDVVKRVDLAFQAFFRRVKAGETPGYPRFKGEGQYDSLTYPQATGFVVHEEAAFVRLSKIGDIQAVVHRALPGRAKTCTVRVQAGKWFACIVCEVEPKPLPLSSEQVGIDVGLEHFAATSESEFVANPRFFRKDEKALAKAQRKVDCLKATRTHTCKAKLRKARRVVSRVHERIRSRRHDFVHQTARKFVNRYGLIAVEALRVQNLSKRPAPKREEQTSEYLPNGASQKAGMNKSIADAAWSLFFRVLTYKAESAGRRVVNVNPAYTSQDCSLCGHRAKKTLAERIHVCVCCGLVLQRDVNAARNILKISTQDTQGVGLHTIPA